LQELRETALIDSLLLQQIALSAFRILEDTLEEKSLQLVEFSFGWILNDGLFLRYIAFSFV